MLFCLTATLCIGQANRVDGCVIIEKSCTFVLRAILVEVFSLVELICSMLYKFEK